MIDVPVTVKEAGARLRSGELTSVALTEAVYARADEIDPQIGTYLDAAWNETRFNFSSGTKVALAQ